ncbi:MAG: CpsD/CapB family tyrosine-protein kinase, partial [Oscillospiraceae bacterium]
NLAITMAQTGAKVILLDADLRKPVQHKIFQKTNTIGISELLSGFAQMNEVMHENVVENLDLITSGAIPPNPSELLGSNNMAQLLDALHEHYDYIFIDTPPINVVADALLLSGKTAGTLLVARQLRTTYDELKKAIESIQQVNGNILGSVITDVKEHDKPYSNYRKYKTYDYQYGRL